MRLNPRSLSAATVLGLLALCGCSPGSPGRDRPPGVGGAPALEPVPEVALTGADEAVRSQLAAARQRVDELGAAAPVPERAAAFAQLGLLYITYDLLEPATACVANARRLEPSDPRWQYLSGYVAGLRGDLPAAIDFYSRALELRPGDLPTLLRRGRARLELADWSGAEADFTAARGLSETTAAAWEGLGRAAAEQGDTGAAASLFRRALELEPEATALHHALARAYRGLGEADRADEHLRRAGDVPTRIPDPLLAPLAEAGESVQFYLVQGAEALENQSFEAAATAFLRVLERDPHSFDAYRGLALALERLGDVEGARATLELALERSAGPTERDRQAQADAQRLLGSLAALAGDETEALERFEASLALAPNQPAVLLRLANGRARQGYLEQALAIYDRLLELAPEGSSALLEKRAVVLVNLRRSDEAIATFERALEVAPGDAALHQRYAEALDFLGLPERARVEREVLAELQADGRIDQVDLLLREAFRLREEGRSSAAVDRYRRALEQSPGRSDVRFGLASLLLESGRFAESAAEFQRLLEQSPRHAAARRGRVAALLSDRRWGEAREELGRALAALPRDRDLALIQIRLLASAPDPAVRDGRLALEVARRVHAEDESTAVRAALALACAAAGEFPEAVALEQQLLREAEQDRRVVPAAAHTARLAAFRRGQPWSALSADEILLGSGAS